ncbi:hypothetical protein MTO96_012254 [Rhipicephalus appendiculatus]
MPARKVKPPQGSLLERNRRLCIRGFLWTLSCCTSSKTAGFHVIECPRCDKTVLHKDLPAHYVTTCLAETTSATTQQPAPQDQALASHEFNAVVGDLKRLLTDHDQLPAIQSQANEVVEHLKKQDAQMLEVARSIADFERLLRHELAQLVGGVSSMVSLMENLRRDERQCDPSKREPFQKSGVDYDAGVTQDSMPWNLENKLILRKLELLLHATIVSLEEMRQGMHPDQRAPTVSCRPVGPTFCHVMNRTLSSSLRHGEQRESKTYLVTVRKASELFDRPGPCRKFAAVTQCHDRDTYFVIYFSSGKRSGIECLILSIECGGFLETSHLVSAAFSVSVLHDEEHMDRPMEKLLSGFPFTGMHFKTELLALKSGGFLRDDELKFQHALCDPCREANASEGRIFCPIDRQPCGNDELRKIQLPETVSKGLKAHCWNEDKGCEFVGTVETLLQHYERECEFRSIRCSLSRETVLLKDLPAHCNEDGCIASSGAAAASTDPNVTRDAVPSVQSIMDAVEKQKRQLVEINQYVSTMQPHIEKLHEDSAKRTHKAQELQRQQADRQRPPEGGGFLAKVRWLPPSKLPEIPTCRIVSPPDSERVGVGTAALRKRRHRRRIEWLRVRQLFPVGCRVERRSNDSREAVSGASAQTYTSQNKYK